MAERTDNNEPRLPLYQWNHRVHQDWAEEQLYIWTFTFTPTYNRDDAVDRVKSALSTFNIQSFAIYELVGEVDILLRLWLPRALDFPRFETELSSKLGDNYAGGFFEVKRIIRHWVWETVDDHPAEPTPEALANRLN